MTKLAIVGAGVAGLAAAFAASSKKCRITLFDAGMSSASWGAGAIDDLPWDEREAALRQLGVSPLRPPPESLTPLDDEMEAFCQAVGVWNVARTAPPMVVLATAAGRLRTARGYEAGLLNLATLRGKRVLLPRVVRAGYDADCLAAALTDDPLATDLGIAFEPVDVPVLRYADETRLPDAELASRCDEEDRLVWLAERLRKLVEQTPGAGAILVGPWLGADAPRASSLSDRVGVPVGELLDPVASAAGARFDAAKTRLCTELGVRLRSAATELETSDGGFRISDGSATATADRVVLAVGNVGSGGLVLRARDTDRAPRGLDRAAPFKLSLGVDAPLAAPLSAATWAGGGLHSLSVIGSLSGLTFDDATWPRGTGASALERLGVTSSEDQTIAPGLYVCGDLMADRPRTVLAAAASGLRAGALAARG